MKRKYLMLLLAAGMTLTVLTGCGATTGNNASQKTTNAAEKETKAAQPQTKATEAQTQAQTPQTQATEAQTQATEAQTSGIVSQTKRVEPLAPSVSMDNLTDCMVSASFTNSDISENGDGALAIHMTVYDYELFDAAEISSLQAGDVLFIDGQDVNVTSIENSGGRVDINGGVDGGGLSLLAGDGGTYFETLGSYADAVYNYQALGDVTLPVDQNFVYDDKSNLEQGEQMYYAGDLLTQSDSVDFSCSERNGVVQIAGGMIVNVTRNYIP